MLWSRLFLAEHVEPAFGRLWAEPAASGSQPLNAAISSALLFVAEPCGVTWHSFHSSDAWFHGVILVAGLDLVGCWAHCNVRFLFFSLCCLLKESKFGSTGFGEKNCSKNIHKQDVVGIHMHGKACLSSLILLGPISLKYTAKARHYMSQQNKSLGEKYVHAITAVYRLHLMHLHDPICYM